MIPQLAVPSGPPDTRPPNKPGTPPPPKDPFFAAVDAILDDLKTPARQPLSSAAAVAGGPVISSRDGKVAAPSESRPDRAGGPPAPGTDFRLPRDVRAG